MNAATTIPILTRACAICDNPIEYTRTSKLSEEEKTAKIWKCPREGCIDPGVIHKYCIEFKAKRDGYAGFKCRYCGSLYERDFNPPRNWSRLFFLILFASYVPQIAFNVMFMWASGGSVDAFRTLTWVPKLRNVFVSLIVSFITYISYVWCMRPCFGLFQRIFKNIFSFKSKKRGTMYTG